MGIVQPGVNNIDLLYLAWARLKRANLDASREVICTHHLLVSKKNNNKKQKINTHTYKTFRYESDELCCIKFRRQSFGFSRSTKRVTCYRDQQ